MTWPESSVRRCPVRSIVKHSSWSWWSWSSCSSWWSSCSWGRRPRRRRRRRRRRRGVRIDVAVVAGVLAGSRSSPSRTPSTSSSRSTSKQRPENLNLRSTGHVDTLEGHRKRAREVAAPRAGRSEEGRASKSKQMLVSGSLEVVFLFSDSVSPPGVIWSPGVSFRHLAVLHTGQA